MGQNPASHAWALLPLAVSWPEQWLIFSHGAVTFSQSSQAQKESLPLRCTTPTEAGLKNLISASPSQTLKLTPRERKALLDVLMTAQGP